MDSLLGVLGNKVESVLPGAKLQVAKALDKAKTYINNMTDLEIKVHEATNHDPWGPHGAVMQGELGLKSRAAFGCACMVVHRAAQQSHPSPLHTLALHPAHLSYRDHKCSIHIRLLCTDHGG